MSVKKEKNQAVPSAETKPTPELNVAPSFTPGPWEVIEGGYDLRHDLSVWPEGANGDGEKRIACWIRTPANARLIASAPALYDTLRFLRRVCAECDIPRIDAALALATEPVTSEQKG